jgi:hypothetical protein
MAIRVIGAGVGRTGTKSLQVALEQLGLNKCYHMDEVMGHPEHIPLWTAAANGQKIDWDRIFQGYQATVDWPGAAFYRQLMNYYPDAKVILSVRDPDSWYASASTTIYPSMRTFPVSWLRRVLPELRQFHHMSNAVIWDGTFHGQFTDKAAAIAIVGQHNAEVQRIVPRERLLVYDVRQGWGPLCAFLKVPVPATPFPQRNSQAEFNQAIRERLQPLQYALGGVLAVASLGIGWLVMRRQQRS